MFLRYRSSSLKLRLFAKSEVRTSRQDFVCPSGYFKVSGKFCLPLVRHPLYAFRQSVLGWCIAHAPLECSNVVYNYSTKPNFERRLINLVEMLKFVSLSCLLWRFSVPFFSTNGKYKACSFAWVLELSSSFVMKLKQHRSSYPFSLFS